MSKQFHGVTSLGWVGVATVIAAVAMFRVSWVLGVVYLVICGVSSGAVLYAYCAKCPCKARCAHVLPGKVTMNIDRQPGPYTRIELTILAVALLALLGLPQIWLWPSIGLFITYWVLSTVAVIQIRLVVCRACDNLYCPLKGQ